MRLLACIFRHSATHADCFYCCRTPLLPRQHYALSHTASPNMAQIRPRVATGQMMRTHARRCLMGLLLILLPKDRIKSLKTPIMESWIFRWIARCIKSFILSKQRLRFQTNLARRQRDQKVSFVGGPNTRPTNPRWQRPPFWKPAKLRYLRSSFAAFDDIWHGNTNLLCNP